MAYTPAKGSSSITRAREGARRLFRAKLPSPSQNQNGTQRTNRFREIWTRSEIGIRPGFRRGMWLMLRQPVGDDYLLATGKTTSVRHFVELAFQYLDIDIEWVGSGVNEQGRDKKKDGPRPGRSVAANFFVRPRSIFSSDRRRKPQKLNWSPRTSVEQLVETMMEAD